MPAAPATADAGGGAGGDPRAADDRGASSPPPDLRATILAMTTGRIGTLCPSEVARSLWNTGWRDRMPAVHAAVDALVEEGAIRLSWKGVTLSTRQGAYRIAGPNR